MAHGRMYDERRNPATGERLACLAHSSGFVMFRRKGARNAETMKERTWMNLPLWEEKE